MMRYVVIAKILGESVQFGWIAICIMMVIIILILYLFILFFFFFQAEDGIRDGTVTGVQTCALPISYSLDGLASIVQLEVRRFTHQRLTCLAHAKVGIHTLVYLAQAESAMDLAERCRSEERRVGKECRSRCAQYD